MLKDPQFLRDYPQYANYGETGVIDSSAYNVGKANIAPSIADVGQPVPVDNTTLIGTNSSNIVASTIVDATDKKNTSYINGDFEGELSLDLRLFSKGGRSEMINDINNIGNNFSKIGSDAYIITPMGTSKIIDGQNNTVDKYGNFVDSPPPHDISF